MAGRPPKAIEDYNIKQVAALSIAQQTTAEIARSLKLTEHQVRRIYKDDRYNKIVKDAADEALAKAKHTVQVKASAPQMIRDVFNALSYQLRERNSVEAVKTWMRMIGLEKEEIKQDTNLQIILPGQAKKEEVAIDATVQDRED